MHGIVGFDVVANWFRDELLIKSKKKKSRRSAISMPKNISVDHPEREGERREGGGGGVKEDSFKKIYFLRGDTRFAALYLLTQLL